MDSPCPVEDSPRGNGTFMSDKVIDVRGVIDRNARVATLKELADQGKKKVKVVNTSQISQMISEAVDTVVARRAMTLAEKERAQLVKESNDEFRRITQERETDRQNQSQQLDELRRELEKARSERDSGGAFRDKANAAEKRVAELQRTHEEDVKTAAAQKAEIRTLEKRVAELSAEIASANKQGGAVASVQADLKALIKSQSENQELVKAQAKQLRDYESKIAAMTEEMTKARSNSVPAEAMANLVSQFAELKSTLEKKAADNSAAVGAMGSIEQLIASKMDAIQTNIARKVENITFKPQEVEAVATEVVLDRIFDHRQHLESNLDNVAVKEAKEGGIGDSLKRLKNFQKPG